GGEVAPGLHQAAPLHRFRGVSHRVGHRAAAVAAGGRLTQRSHRARRGPRACSAPPGRLRSGRITNLRPGGAVTSPVAPGRSGVEIPRHDSPQIRDAPVASASTPFHPPPHPSHQQGVPMSVANSINWFELYVQDMPRARAFYETLLGVTLESLKLPEG